MHRTSLFLPNNLKIKLEKEAQKEKISFAELVRRALEKYLLAKQGATAQDAFLSSQTVFEDDGPFDTALHHDKYLLERGPH